MTPSDIHAAAVTLAARRLSGSQGPLLAAPQAPQTLAEALAIQQAVSALINDGIAGWKCGLPGDGRVVVAPIYASTVAEQGGCPVWLRANKVRVEPELAFVFAGGLPLREQPYSVAELQAAISSVHLALELIDSRYLPDAAPPFLQALADGLVNQGLWLGPSVPRAAAFASSHLALSVSQHGQTRSLAGVHPAGDPLAPLYWLQDFLAVRGEAILPGQCVITGSYAGVIEVDADAGLALTFGELGTLSVCFHAR